MHQLLSKSLTNAFDTRNLPAIFISREFLGRHLISQRHQQIFNDNFPCSKFGILASFLKKKKKNNSKPLINCRNWYDVLLTG